MPMMILMKVTMIVMEGNIDCNDYGNDDNDYKDHDEVDNLMVVVVIIITNKAWLMICF